MSILSWFLTRRNQKFYLLQDFRVMLNSLRMWDSNTNSWIHVIDGLPTSYGRVSATTVYMQGVNNLMFALLFRENPTDFFGTPKIHPIMIFYTYERGFWREDFSNMKSLKDRIGTHNYNFLKAHAAIDWKRTIIA